MDMNREKQQMGGRRHMGTKKRHGNASLRAWVTFVKKVQREEGVGYKEAMTLAKKRKDRGEKWRGGAGEENSAVGDNIEPTPVEDAMINNEDAMINNEDAMINNEDDMINNEDAMINNEDEKIGLAALNDEYGGGRRRRRRGTKKRRGSKKRRGTKKRRGSRRRRH